MGQLLGAVFGMALFGAIMAWIIRFVFRRLPLFWSYGLGLALFLPPAAWSWHSNHPEVSLSDSFIVYGIAGILAFPVLVSTSFMGKQKDPRAEKARSGSRLRIFRFFGWVVFSLLVALGATCLFAAFKGDGPDASLPFFVGALFLVGAFFLWRYLSKKSSSLPYNQLPSEQDLKP